MPLAAPHALAAARLAPTLLLALPVTLALVFPVGLALSAQPTSSLLVVPLHAPRAPQARSRRLVLHNVLPAPLVARLALMPQPAPLATPASDFPVDPAPSVQLTSSLLEVQLLVLPAQVVSTQEWVLRAATTALLAARLAPVPLLVRLVSKAMALAEAHALNAELTSSQLVALLRVFLALRMPSQFQGQLRAQPVHLDALHAVTPLPALPATQASAFLVDPALNVSPISSRLADLPPVLPVQQALSLLPGLLAAQPVPLAALLALTPILVPLVTQGMA